MRPRPCDEAEYRFLTAPGASLHVRLVSCSPGSPEVQVFGNRAGLLSLANVLLWLVATAWRRELLSLAELPFADVEPPLSICLRLNAEEGTGRDGLLTRTDRGEQMEWIFAEDDLRRVSLLVHQLASNPAHEYDRLQMADGSIAEVHIRMTDAAGWIFMTQGLSG
jgi:hypothetical protein